MTDGPYVIGCDVGSQGTNAALYAADGTLVASAYETYDLSFPYPGGAEQDPDAWPAAIVTGVRELLEEVPEGPAAVKGLSFGSQLDGMVVCGTRRAAPASGDDLDGSPRRGAGGGGRRTDAARDVLPRTWARTSTRRTRCSRRCGSATRSRRSGRTRRTLMSPGTYVLRERRGTLAVDYSNASSLALLDPRTRAWSPEVLAAVDVSPRRCSPSSSARPSRSATITTAFARGDRAWTRRRSSRWGAATRWRRRSAPACSSRARCATSWGRPSPCAPRRASRARTRRCSSNATRTPTRTRGCSRTPGSSRAATSGGGATSSRRSNGGPRPRGSATPTTSSRREAERVPPGAEGLVFLPCMQGAMAPEWNGAARGVFYGLTLAHTRAHMTRAILEGSAFALRDIVEAMANAGLDVAPADDRGRRREGPAVAPDQGGRHGSAGARPDQRGDDGDGRRDPGGGRRRAPRERRGRGRGVRLYRPDEHEPDDGHRSTRTTRRTGATARSTPR